MENQVMGIHHITAIAGNARRNLNFYTKVLGLRFVKKTVNFDDPGTYHFYFGDETGSPGTILTFFPWEGITQGKQGRGMATEIGYSVPEGSLKWWKDRLSKVGSKITGEGERLGEPFIAFEDPDGLPVSMIISSSRDRRKPWETEHVKAGVATRGFHSVSLSLDSVSETARVLTDVLGYTTGASEGNRHRFTTSAVEGAAIVDLLETPDLPRAINAGGTIHHIAFRVKDEQTLMEYRNRVVRYGLNITPKIDRNYFFSVYFREPGGVLFELATDNPGFAVDEPVESLGTHLKLPAQYESSRAEIEKILPSLS